ncbi:MAG: hypothetical protein M3256_00120 [Actinomycetota bacterium]|nr:hypothetical protein [Actinomycetota bacterium]
MTHGRVEEAEQTVRRIENTVGRECSFWLAECLAYQGELEQARAVFDRVLTTSNDLGLYAEEYETSSCRMLGRQAAEAPGPVAG